ncbi:dynein axonemal intermediate chain 3 [Condylostylus longicornis]|uniref:dynein axonemal intermediate chain 3 n=1 Tax=Condylostylus longicornis TaxID=2530218 RepID=UPI00244DCAAC|nr:dynein axonemal intermediate chain 3 [Condylostylus longicornis]
MADPTTRIEEENKHLNLTEEDVIEPNAPAELFGNYGNELTLDEQDEKFRNFDLKQAWEELLGLEKQVFMIHPEVQEQMGILVGVNLSQEYAWKRIKCRSLLENVIDVIDDAKERKKLLKPYKNTKMDALLLIGYIPILTQNDKEPNERDPFVVFYEKDIIKQALEIIQAIEEYEKWAVEKIYLKKPHLKWDSHGSEKEVILGTKRTRDEEIDVEMQSVFPLKYNSDNLSMRKADDVRDGYAELIPGEKKFDNIFRKRISVAVQAKSPEITLEQQTDPTFPTNAWTQYHFKVEEGETGLDVTSEEEESRPGSGKGTPVTFKKPPPPLSQNIENLLEILNFNQIDMYRNDYSLISTKPIPRYTCPYLEEILCFTDLKETLHQKILSISWYPALSGLVACCYSHFPGCGVIDINEPIENFIADKNQVLFWSLSDSLKYKLQCYAPREILSLSFCPYSPQFLVGGCITGQIMLWDLMDKIEKLDEEEMLSQNQTKYRLLMMNFLDWAKTTNEKMNLAETISSDIGLSHSNAVTKIDWLDRYIYITVDGKLHRSSEPKNRFFITTSIDGSIAFWDLDIDLSRKINSKPNRGKLPPTLSAMESSFRKYDRVFKPVFMVCTTEALTSNQFANIGLYEYKPDYDDKLPKSIMKKFPIKVSRIDRTEARQLVIETNIEEYDEPNKKIKPNEQSFLACSLFGNILHLYWDGFDDVGEQSNKEKVSTFQKYANVHDGPILQLERNFFFPEIFITIGRYVFAIWRENYFVTPILWRKRSCELTSVSWSVDRPSIFYIGRNDGNFEAWDILARDDEPILSDMLGGGILTAIAEHRPKVPNKIMAVGDYVGCLRMVNLPKILQNTCPNEKELLQEYIDKEMFRKQKLITWEKKWNKKNEDIIEARKLIEDEVKIELEKLRKLELKAKKKDFQREEVETPEQSKKKSALEIAEMLERKWEEINMKRIFEALMIRKQMNAEKLEIETKIEKRRLAYERSKKIALKKGLARIDDDIAALRVRIFPVIKEDISRSQLIEEYVDNILLEVDLFEKIKEEADELIERSISIGDINISEFFTKGLERRKILNQKLGSNFMHAYSYDILKDEKSLDVFEFDLSRFTQNKEQNLKNITEDSKAGGDILGSSNDFNITLDD